jgi:hypothetical protein
MIMVYATGGAEPPPHIERRSRDAVAVLNHALLVN